CCYRPCCCGSDLILTHFRPPMAALAKQLIRRCGHACAAHQRRRRQRLGAHFHSTVVQAADEFPSPDQGVAECYTRRVRVRASSDERTDRNKSKGDLSPANGGGSP